MGRKIQAWSKVDRRFGVVISGKLSGNKILTKRNFPPGQHGRTKGRRTKSTEFGLRLNEKQKLKMLYGGLRESQFRKYFDKASKAKGNTASIMIELLERRLDNVVYRLGIACTRRQARQFVGHGHIMVNNKKVDVASFQVNVGDVIEVASKDIPQIRQNLENLDPRSVPHWLEIDKDNFKGKVVDKPKDVVLEVPINMQYIIEYYSRV
jgi:small subunit ribosomal protein S4